MAVDQTNPFLQLSMQSMLAGNPYTQNNGKLSMPGFRGLATDAQGRPIQSDVDAIAASQMAAPSSAPAQGTTLNTPGVNPNAAMIQFLQNQDQGIVSSPSGNAGGFGSGNSGPLSEAQRNQIVDNSTQISQLQKQAAAPAAAPAAASTTNGVDLRQAYLDALANPGHVATQGATVPQSQPLGVPSVLQAFLAAHPSGGGKGAGSYDNSGFFDTLNRLGTA